MALFGIGKKKPEEVKKPGKGYFPTDRVKGLSNKGFSEPEIIDVLRKEGFSSEEIDRALTQVLKIEVTGEVVDSKEVVRDLIYETRLKFIDLDEDFFRDLGEFIKERLK